MSYAEAQERFQQIRSRLKEAGLRNHEVDQWLRSPHAELDGLSPARCLHCGREGDVDKLVEKMK